MKKPSLTSLGNFLFCSHTQMCHHLPSPSCSSVRESIHYLWCHVVGDAEGQVLQDALHAVVMLLAGGAKVLLQSSCHGGENGLGCFSGVHHLSWSLLLLLCLEAFDVSESLFYRNHKPAAKKIRTARIITRIRMGLSLRESLGARIYKLPIPNCHQVTACHQLTQNLLYGRVDSSFSFLAQAMKQLRAINQN